MGTYTVIPQDTFEALQLDAGVLLNTFDPTSPAAPDDEDIICATTGGIKIDCIPTFSDLGEDVDNCPVNMMELKHLDSWECKIGFTSLGTSAELIKMALGCADASGSTYVKTSDTALVSGKTYYTQGGTSPNYTYSAVATPNVSNIGSYYEKTNDNKVLPRRDLEQTDFGDIWWVGDRADGGLVAVKLLNALSTSGLSLQTTKSGKGQIAVELTGHVSIEDQDTMPMEFYSIDPAA